MPDYRFSANINESFWNSCAVFAQPCSASATQDYSFHYKILPKNNFTAETQRRREKQKIISYFNKSSLLMLSGRLNSILSNLLKTQRLNLVLTFSNKKLSVSVTRRLIFRIIFFPNFCVFQKHTISREHRNNQTRNAIPKTLFQKISPKKRGNRAKKNA